MDNIKKAGIIGGAAVGAVIGGAISIAGHLSKNKFVDELGESIIDSTILTGSIAGQVASGAADVLTGSIRKNRRQLHKGQNDLKAGGRRILQNYVNNARMIIDNSGEIVEGTKERNISKVLNGAKTLGKIIAVGTITVGAIKINTEKGKTKDCETQQDID